MRESSGDPQPFHGGIGYKIYFLNIIFKLTIIIAYRFWTGWLWIFNTNWSKVRETKMIPIELFCKSIHIEDQKASAKDINGLSNFEI
jgi:hypothetical protein